MIYIRDNFRLLVASRATLARSLVLVGGKIVNSPNTGANYIVHLDSRLLGPFKSRALFNC
jgi:hypothetical protein